jgi:dTDP-4-amino-4,6-dideoxygalactose transaminase
MPRPVTVGDFRASPTARKYVNQVLDSGRLSYGPFSKQFEQQFARMHDSKFAVFCNSGTSALHISVAALKAKYGWRDGDEVLVPATTFVATANVCIHNNLTPVFVDVDPHTYNLDPHQIPKRLSLRTKAIIPVHLAGQPANMTAIEEYTDHYGLKVIEDSCETTFALCKGKKVGAWGEVGCFSTYMAHYVVTGVGGLCTTSDPQLAAKLRSLMNHGRDGIYISIDDDAGLKGAALREVIDRRFKFNDVGHSFRVTEMEAALGLAQLEEADENVRRRKAVAARYTQGLLGLDGVIQVPTAAPGCEHVYMIYPLVCRRAGDKAKLTQLLEENGVETRDLLPMVNQPVYAKYGDLRAENPVSAGLVDNGFYVGCHQYITDEDADRVVGLIRKFFA